MTVDRRRRIRVWLLGVLGSMLIAVPPLAACTAAPPGLQPQPAASAAPESAPSSVVASSTVPPPDGRITNRQLAAGQIEVPAWAGPKECPSGRVKPALGHEGSAEPYLVVSQVVHTNLDSDNPLETAVVLQCPIGDPSPEQVLAYDRDAAGKIVLIGRIYGQGDDVAFTKEIAARPGGGLRVTVCVGSAADGRCGSDEPAGSFRQREYAWDGGKFALIK